MTRFRSLTAVVLFAAAAFLAPASAQADSAKASSTSFKHHWQWGG